MPVEAHDPLYLEAYRQSVQDPVSFWEKQAHLLDWDRPWQKVLDNSNPPFTKWYVGGYLNACYNSIDRHILAGRGAKVALIHDSPLTGTVRRVTYQELYDQIIQLAGGLAKMGVVKGDRVVIYMPLIPETIIFGFQLAFYILQSHCKVSTTVRRLCLIQKLIGDSQEIFI